MLIQSLFENALRHPDAVAIDDERGPTTYAQLAASASALSIYIGQQTTLSRIGLLLPAGSAFVTSFYAALLAGKSVVPINFLLGDREISHVLTDSGIDTIISHPLLAGRLKDKPFKVIDLAQLPPPTAFVAPTFPSTQADDPAVLMYTSGSSGQPKGVLLTYGNLQSDVDACIEHAALESRHVFLGVIPLFHAFGMTAMMLAPIQLGAHIVYMGRFSAVGALEAIRKHKVSLMFGVPSMMAALLHLKNASAEDFVSIYALITGGEPLSPALRDGFQTRFGQTLYEGYGMTETSPVICLNVPTSSRVGSVGRPIPGVQIRIADDNDQPLLQGQPGEIQVHGPMVMKGYHHLPAESELALCPDGFLRTGDIGHVDADGFVFITGRKKEMISIAGEKAYPREIEDILMLHPAVAEAAVVGKKDASRGEVIAAFIRLKEGQTATPESLREFCREQGLVPWKCPREIVITDEFPRSPTGKVLKRQLKEQIDAAG